MGEITEALRRAKRDRGSRGRSRDAYPKENAHDSAVARAGIDANPQPELDQPRAPAAGPEPAKAIPLREAADGREVVSFPRDKTGSWAARAVLLDPSAPHTERFRHFAVRVREEMLRRRMKSILVTSSVREEGKTFTSCNLAFALASVAAEKRIAFVELDIRRPTASRSMGIAPRVGIEEVLTGANTLDSARIPTELSSLDLYLVRQPPSQAHEILALPRLANVCRELDSHYDLIVVDSPPVLPVPDVSLILPHVDACVAVVRAGTSRMKNVHELMGQLMSDKLLGVFVNDTGNIRRQGQYAYYASEDETR